MKRFLFTWFAWFCFLIAIVSIVAEGARYIIGDIDPLRGIWVGSVSSLCLSIWWTILE